MTLGRPLGFPAAELRSAGATPMASPSSSRSPADGAEVREACAAKPASIADVLEWLRRSFRADRAGALTISYQFELSGGAGGSLWARIDGGCVEAQPGRVADPDVLLRLAACDLFGYRGVLSLGDFYLLKLLCEKHVNRVLNFEIPGQSCQLKANLRKFGWRKIYVLFRMTGIGRNSGKVNGLVL